MNEQENFNANPADTPLDNKAANPQQPYAPNGQQYANPQQPYAPNGQQYANPQQPYAPNGQQYGQQPYGRPNQPYAPYGGQYQKQPDKKMQPTNPAAERDKRIAIAMGGSAVTLVLSILLSLAAIVPIFMSGSSPLEFFTNSFLLLGAIGILLIWIFAKKQTVNMSSFVLCAIGYGVYFSYEAGYNTYEFFRIVFSGYFDYEDIISLIFIIAYVVFATIFTVNILKFSIAHCKLSRNIALPEGALSTITPVSLIILYALTLLGALIVPSLYTDNIRYISSIVRSANFYITAVIINSVKIFAAVVLFNYRSKLSAREF